jgi:hypothetical protein
MGDTRTTDPRRLMPRNLKVKLSDRIFLTSRVGMQFCVVAEAATASLRCNAIDADGARTELKDFISLLRAKRIERRFTRHILRPLKRAFLGAQSPDCSLRPKFPSN